MVLLSAALSEKHVSTRQFWTPFFDIPLRFLRFKIALRAFALCSNRKLLEHLYSISKALGIVWTTEIIEGKRKMHR